jgi:hypothetical protein
MASLTELTTMEDTVSIGGVKYTFSPIDAVGYAEIYREIKKGRPDPIAAARQLAEGLPAEERREIFKQAYNDALRARDVTARELDEWMATIEGCIYCFWLTIRKAHPAIDYEMAKRLVEQLGKEALLEIVSDNNGLPEVNPSMPTQEQPTPTA